MLMQNKSDMWPGNMTRIEAYSTALPALVIFLPRTLIRDKFIIRQASQGCCCNARLAKSAATGSAGWQVIKLQSSHWYQQTSLSILMCL